MKVELNDLTWPSNRLGEALSALATQSGLPVERVGAPDPIGHAAQQNESLARWIEACASWMGIEAEPAEVSVADLESFLATAAPVLLRIPGAQPEFLAVLRSRPRRIAILGPDLLLHQVSVKQIAAEVRRGIYPDQRLEINQLLSEAGVPQRRQALAADAILIEKLRNVTIRDCWYLRLPPGAALWQQVRREQLVGPLIGMASAHLVEYVLWIAAWRFAGAEVLQGHLDPGWLLGCGLLLLTIVPIRQMATWWQGRVAIGAAGILKQRLLAGALRLEPDESRREGSGQFLARIIESQSVESLALNGGFLSLFAMIELIVTSAALVRGLHGLLEVGLLAFWVGLTLLLSWRFYRHQQDWSNARLEMTHDLVERLAGHRTRSVQESRAHWHDEEDRMLERYWAVSHRADRSASWMSALIPRGWLVLGLSGLLSSFMAGRPSPTTLAVGLAGVLLGFQALKNLVSGMGNIAGAGIAWKQVSLLFHAAARPEVHPPPMPARDVDRNEVVLEAHDLQFSRVIHASSLRVCSGDRLLLEGASGAGKSTLASLIAGLRAPDRGLLLARGLDRQTLGLDGWRRHVVMTPQFHENHVLTGTFAFNLLLGNERWEEAESICHELGLDDLLRRMPCGMFQQVGESGWQLSHGERSRLYIARALLHDADLLILDESFAALDPENLARAFKCVLRRAPTLLVIAHP